MWNLYVIDNWIKTKHPDFDIFIDDSAKIISECQEKFVKHEKEKIFVLPDYKPARNIQGSNVYHLTTSVSDLKDKDFTKAAKEKTMTDNNKQIDAKSNLLWSGLIALVLCGLRKRGDDFNHGWIYFPLLRFFKFSFFSWFIISWG